MTTAVSCASVVGMKTRPNTGSAAAGVVQPCSYAVVSQAGAPTRLLEQRQKAGGATLDSMVATQDQTTATRSGTTGIRLQHSGKVSAAANRELAPLSLDSRKRW